MKTDEGTGLKQRAGWHGPARRHVMAAVGLVAVLVMAAAVIGQAGGPALAAGGPSGASGVVPGTVRVTNVTGGKFSVSWLSTEAVTGAVRYGTWPHQLTSVRGDDLDGSRRTHHVSPGDDVSALLPDTWYYYDILSGSSVDDNGGVHYLIATGPDLETLPDPGTVALGRVVTGSGGPVAESLVYLTLNDADWAGSAGSSAPQSVISVGPFWQFTPGSIRESDLGAYFGHLTTTDRIDLAVQGNPDGQAMDRFVMNQALYPLSRTVTVTAGILAPPPAPTPLPGSTGPDLVVDSIQASTGYPVAGCSAAITVTVRNAGNTPVTQPFRVALYLDHSRVPYPGERSNTNTWWAVNSTIPPSGTIALSSLVAGGRFRRHQPADGRRHAHGLCAGRQLRQPGDRAGRGEQCERAPHAGCARGMHSHLVLSAGLATLENLWHATPRPHTEGPTWSDCGRPGE